MNHGMVVGVLRVNTTETVDDTTRYYIHRVRTNIYMGLYGVYSHEASTQKYMYSPKYIRYIY